MREMVLRGEVCEGDGAEREGCVRKMVLRGEGVCVRWY